ncbi:hypothetical protein LCL89_09800 [Halobacillus yeomjeoni]|uniref:hypothetical protein n=1 Tax=Halobacillus yeomjeoni TaxID=311194 RepID=UPI001CD1E81F|nr:hypothetical protein [Halobacillus yeomjeoni]MCA0984339.1 hypothetical protein [Halobacillus yeomjeoni]
MKVKAVMIVFVLLLLAGCQEKTVKEIVEDEEPLSYEVIEIIDATEWEEKKLVAYLAEEDFKMIKFGFYQIEGRKWNLTHSDFRTPTDQPLNAGHSRYFTFDGDEVPFLYGTVGDEDIHSVKVKKENGFEEIPIHESKWGRVFYSPYSWGPVKALDSEGNVIHEEDFR